LLQDQSYAHGKTEEWIQSISDQAQEALAPFRETFKIIIQSIIMSKHESVGFKTSSSCCWDDSKDDVCSYRWENASMRLVVTVFAVAY